MKKFFYVIGIIAMTAVLGGTAKAMVISPPLIELEANRGDQLANTVKLKNDGEITETYYLSTQAFRAAGEDGKPQFIADNFDIVSWISFQFDSVTLQPGQTTSIPFTLNVPKDAPPGGHYAAVFATTTPPSVGGSAVQIQARIGTLILVTVAGVRIESARIIEFSTEKDSYNVLPVNFTVRMQNNGNVHLKPTGEIIIRNFLDVETSRMKINEDEGNILPESMRKFTAIWGKSSSKTGFWENYRNECIERAFGKYTARLAMDYGNGRVLNGDVSFWVIPVERIIVNMFILLIFVTFLVLAIRKYNIWLFKSGRIRTSGKKK